MELLFERSRPGRGTQILPPLDVPEYSFDEGMTRSAPPRLPEMAETDVCRHYSKLESRCYGVNDGFYPLGSCTMKYNPKINDELAGLPGFAQLHPLQDESSVQGAMEALKEAEEMLCEITGMDAMSFQPAAGAQGEFTGLLLIKAYHENRGEGERRQIIVPDSAHGTNPASANMVGYQVVNLPSDERGCVDLDALKEVVGPKTAGLMLTNPNTLGIFEPDIAKITRIVHDAGGLNYYDGANLNAIMGVVRPGDMGFDVVHLNLHKSFSTPHGGGGPGSGPVGCKELLMPFLPENRVEKSGNVYRFARPEHSIGSVRAFYGNYLVTLKALCYILSLGAEGVREVAQGAVLNANYMMERLKPYFPVATEGHCMHEFVMTLEEMKKNTGVSAMDVAKGLLERGMHPPTMYFPLIVKEALMVEPTETESRETLDRAVETFIEVHNQALEDPELLHQAPEGMAIRRADEVRAARHPVLRYDFTECPVLPNN